MNELPTIKVVYILGSGRCGSTLLDRALRAQEEVVGVGELARIWKTGMVHGALCSCGQPFAQCRFWSAVSRDAFGSWDSAFGLQLHAMRKKVVRHRHIPRMLWWKRHGLPATGSAAELAEKMLALYTAIIRHSGASFIVDSSKNGVLPFFLRTISGLDVSVIHLVRDSRAVAWSWQRRRPRLRERMKLGNGPPAELNGSGNVPQWMPQYSLGKSGRHWLGVNYVGSLLGRLDGITYTRIRYEDMMSDLPGALHQIGQSIGYPYEIDAARQAETPSCIFAGNPMRFERGTSVSSRIWSGKRRWVHSPDSGSRR